MSLVKRSTTHQNFPFNVLVSLTKSKTTLKNWLISKFFVDVRHEYAPRLLNDGRIFAHAAASDVILHPIINGTYNWTVSSEIST